MSLYLVKTPNLIKKLFNRLVWSFNTSEKVLFLTFDDGPTPEITPFILKTLKQYNAQATFFCVGENIQKHPEVFQEIIGKNHAIGNHTFNHLKGWKTTNYNYINNTDKAQLTIEKFKKTKLKLFRPPYGKIGYFQSKKLLSKGYKIIMWDVLSGDFDSNITKEKVLSNVLKNSTNGSIIVFHDHQKAFDNLKFTLPKVLEYFNVKGYRFEAIK
ncbi:MAG: polysaccharide deacetylase family protein [Bacteroidetes bacterium]|nr:polysaccharide deacetylase family protein [Bacteroidota bacterium]